MAPTKRFQSAVSRQGGTPRPTRPRTRVALLLSVLAALLLGQFIGSVSRVHAQGPLPIYTSPIDVTGLRLQLQASVPDRDTGQPVNTPLPVGLLGPKFNELTSRPLSTQIDEYWNVKPDPRTGKTPRQQACDRIRQGLDDAVAKAGEGFSVYDFDCSLATRGTLLLHREGSALTFGYTLLDSSIEFYVTTPATCNRHTFAPLCPNDPGLKVSLVPQLVMTLRTPEVCRMTATNGTAVIQSPDLETRGVLRVAELADTVLFGGWYSSQAEQAIRQTTQDVPLPLDDALAELRDSAPCRERSSPAGRVVAAFHDVETAIEPAQGAIILRLSHPPIAPPRFQNVSLPSGPDTCVSGYVWREAFEGDHVCVTPETRRQAAADNAAAASRREPNGGAYGPDTCRQGFVWRAARPEDHVCVTPERRDQTANDNAQASQRRVLGESTPSFTRPSIAAPPIAAAGSTIKVSGQFFPRPADPTTLFLSLERDTTSACLGGATELEWGPDGGAMRVEKLPGDGLSCTSRHEAKSLRPATAYRFRARDCNALTCSPWSEPVTLTTAASAGPSGVTLTLDGASLGTATVTAQGTFDVDVVIPAGTAAGERTIRAVSGAATADTSLQVTAASGGGRASILLTGSFFGDRGCPTRALPDYAQAVEIDAPFSVYGTGFAPGRVTLRLDSATGMELGTATVGADGTFCHDAFRGPPASQVGNHTLVAVQNGTAQATIPVRVVRPSPVR
ncbi:MAG TPA: hypothetical protein VK066_14070 [Chloroflexota bacterium]|nr:hypothetical protein [Chloroflexota bacterium]